MWSGFVIRVSGYTPRKEFGMDRPGRYFVGSLSQSSEVFFRGAETGLGTFSWEATFLRRCLVFLLQPYSLMCQRLHQRRQRPPAPQWRTTAARLTSSAHPWLLTIHLSPAVSKTTLTRNTRKVPKSYIFRSVNLKPASSNKRPFNACNSLAMNRASCFLKEMPQNGPSLFIENCTITARSSR